MSGGSRAVSLQQPRWGATLQVIAHSSVSLMFRGGVSLDERMRREGILCNLIVCMGMYTTGGHHD